MPFQQGLSSRHILQKESRLSEKGIKKEKKCTVNSKQKKSTSTYFFCSTRINNQTGLVLTLYELRLTSLYLPTLRFHCVLLQGCGSGSGSVLDPYSIGSLDPDPGGQKLHIKIERLKIFNLLKFWIFSLEG